jgi:LysR family transcriptional regulator, chromosome initiation inhibitor
MLDYSLISAVAAVVREGSFERAARSLHVTPSAVSQRVKLLEQRLGQVLVQRSVTRGQPCTATEAGRQLCRHAEQVAMLEHELARGVPHLHGGETPFVTPFVTLRVAVNADSLATWFMAAMAQFAAADTALLDLRLEDQDHTAEQLRTGDVLAAVTALAEPVQGCSSVPLGDMAYVATASPAFVKRFFGEHCGDQPNIKVTAATLAQAPCLTFNHKDRLQDQWMAALLGAEAAAAVAPPRHWLPAAQAFVDATLAGLGWGMNPQALVQDALRSGALLELAPGQPLWVPLHWQHARGHQGSVPPMLARLSTAVRSAARLYLRQPPPTPTPTATPEST